MLQYLHQYCFFDTQYLTKKDCVNFLLPRHQIMSETPPVPLPEGKRTSSPPHNAPTTKRAKRGPQGGGMGGHVTESDLVVSSPVFLPLSQLSSASQHACWLDLTKGTIFPHGGKVENRTRNSSHSVRYASSELPRKPRSR